MRQNTADLEIQGFLHVLIPHVADSQNGGDGRRDRSGTDGNRNRGDSGRIIRTRCPRLQAPQNGNVKFVSTSPGSFAKYTCNSGYGLSGNTYRKCLSTGQWTGRTPTCRCEHLHFKYLRPQYSSSTYFSECMVNICLSFKKTTTLCLNTHIHGIYTCYSAC